ncbi:carboxymuconolactone decarboxylase family protein [Desulfobulbus sp. AH-315-M07]|nr:carboxymuconolactone decarboxylase family protein [Desulfobulbus sp. AH-315-M07]
MAWIRTIDESEAEGELAEVYSTCADPKTKRVDNVLKIQSLRPASLRAHLDLYRDAMKGSKTLPKAKREMIAVVVSRFNDCHY